MNDIKLMDENLANKIAAGEIIERPLSVVKELVENAIDANADSIEIELKESGITQIIVRDNGDGMSKENIALCTKRHATSKLYSDKDLFKIATLGFRGEALASIFAVSKFEITSSTSKEAYCLSKTENEEFEIKEVSANKGTTVSIKHLFYNTPARYKHLNNPYYELAVIISYVNKLALTMPNVSFKLINDDKVVLHTFGNGDIKSGISQVYSAKLAKNMIELNLKSENFEVDGFISHPNDTRSKKSYITLAINGRIIRNYEIENAIINGYDKFLHTNQYPIAILNINLDYSLVDVNIHPTKQQVKISMIEELVELIKNEIDHKLKSLMYIAFEDNTLEEKNVEVINEVITNKSKITTDQDTSMLIDTSIYDDNNSTEQQSLFEQDDIIESDFETPRLPKMSYIGPLKQTYLLFQNEDGLFMLDQHAAQERINYELIYQKFVDKEFNYQQLLEPFTIELNNYEYEILQPNLTEFEKIGLKIEEFGPNTIKLSEVDNFYFKAYSLKTDVEVIINKFIKSGELDFAKQFEDLAIVMACKSSIKANHYLNVNDVEALINELNMAKHPYTCPHGRPVIVNVGFNEIEKMFKRVFGS